MSAKFTVTCDDARRWSSKLLTNSVHTIVTSPPYYRQRKYGGVGEIGTERTPQEYIERLGAVFDSLLLAVHDSGSLWLNIDDTVDKETRQPLLIPWLLLDRVKRGGWKHIQTIIWAKKSPDPTSAADKLVHSFEYVFRLAPVARGYYHDRYAARENMVRVSQYKARRKSSLEVPEPESFGRGMGDVWHLSTRGFSGGHFATMPIELAERCILISSSEAGVCPACSKPIDRLFQVERIQTRPGTASKATGDREAEGRRDPGRHVSKYEHVGWQRGCSCRLDPDGPDRIPAIVADPFTGSGTTGVAAIQNGRSFVGCDLLDEYVVMARKRLSETTPQIAGLC